MKVAHILVRLKFLILRSPFAKYLKFLSRLIARADVLARKRAAGRHMEMQSLVSRQLSSRGYVDATPLLCNDLFQLCKYEATKLANESAEHQANIYSSKKIWVSLLDQQVQAGRFTTESPFFKLVTSDPIITALAQYYGEIPILKSVHIFHSKGLESQELSDSKLWHRDYDDTNVIKLQVYFSEVLSPQHGPFTVLPATASDVVGRTLRTRLADQHPRISALFDSKVEFFSDRVSAVLCNTSRCLHMGGRVAHGSERIMLTATFIQTPDFFQANRQPIAIESDDREEIRLLVSK